MTEKQDAGVIHVYEEWHRAWNEHDLLSVMALYADDATLETPSILAVYPDQNEGILHGKENIEKLFATNLQALSKEFKDLYRTSLFLANGKHVMWEYPGKTPRGRQIDLVESMDIENGLIVYHRVYWGWKGLSSLLSLREKRRS